MKDIKNATEAFNKLAQILANVQIAQPCQNKLKPSVAQRAIREVVKVSTTVPLDDGITLDLSNADLYSKHDLIKNIKAHYTVSPKDVSKGVESLKAIKSSKLSYIQYNDFDGTHSLPLLPGGLKEINLLIHNVAEDLFNTIVDSKLHAAQPTINRRLKASTLNK